MGPNQKEASGKRPSLEKRTSRTSEEGTYAAAVLDGEPGDAGVNLATASALARRLHVRGGKGRGAVGQHLVGGAGAWGESARDSNSSRRAGLTHRHIDNASCRGCKGGGIGGGGGGVRAAFEGLGERSRGDLFGV